jgi:general secretion pathway protein B
VSYILEALKKAEAQRGQGQVPGIHDQHMAPEFSGGASPGGQSLLIWIIMAMGLVMIGLLVWALWQPESPATQPMVAAREAAPVAKVAPAAPVVALTHATANVPPMAAPQAPVLPSRYERKAHNEDLQAPPPAEAKRTAKPEADELPDLPEAMKPQLPKLAFGGAMHSDTPANRMLIVNGQLLHEGDAISNDLTLERIQLKQATFRFKGHRYTAQY